MNKEKFDELAKRVQVLMINTHASLTCLAEDAFQMGDQNLYTELREFGNELDKKSKELLRKHGASIPEKSKTKLRVVKNH
jgi:hypothetical protein